MNTTELPVRPDVAAFVAQVRDLLGDLSEEERLELTEGLEADLADQVAERGGGALGDPEAYARELRAAAGFDPVPRARRLHVPTGRSLAEQLDIVRHLWDMQVARPRVAPVWSVVAALRPVWWFFRAWIAAVLLCVAMPGYTPWGVTWLPGVSNELGLVILGACVVGSTLVGMGRVWPGGASASHGTAARVVLIGLNLFALAMIPAAEQRYQDAEWAQVQEYGFADSSWTADVGVLNRGEQVCNIAADDADGQPLTGGQLFDQAGRPLDVRCYGQQDRTVPWVLGDVTRWNVFPIGERDRPARTPQRRADLTGAAFPVPDRATTPAVTNPLVPEEVDEREDRSSDERKRKDERERVSRR